MYYYYNEDMDGFVEVSHIFRSPCLVDEREIPLANVVLFQGKIYDNRTIEYWKDFKSNELETFKKTEESKPFNTSVNVLTNVNYDTIIENTFIDTLSNANGGSSNIDFVDYNGELLSLSQSNFKKVFKDLGNRAKNIQKAYINYKIIIKNSTNVEELKTLIFTLPDGNKK